MLRLARPLQVVILASATIFAMSSESSASMVVASTSAMTLTPQQRAQGITVEDLEANPKKLGSLTTTIDRNASSRFRFSGMVSYGARQDLAAERTPFIATHRMLLMGTVTILDRPAIIGFDDELANEMVTMNVAASGQFTTLDQEVQGNVHGGPVEPADVDVSASRAFEFAKLMGASNILDVSVGSSIPTSEASQFEGVTAVPYASLGWALGFQGGRYNVSQSLSADYVVNKFAYSPTTYEVNGDYSGGYTLSTSARIGGGFRFTVGGTARMVHHLDDTMTAALSNFQILSWTRGFVTVTLRHTNGSRAEDHQTSLWFVDEYKRIVSLGMSVRF
jgi:hypothetical protein